MVSTVSVLTHPDILELCDVTFVDLTGLVMGPGRGWGSCGKTVAKSETVRGGRGCSSERQLGYMILWSSPTRHGKATKRIVSHQWGGFFRRSRRMALHRLRHLLHSAAAHRTVRPLAAQRGSAARSQLKKEKELFAQKERSAVVVQSAMRGHAARESVHARRQNEIAERHRQLQIKLGLEPEEPGEGLEVPVFCFPLNQICHISPPKFLLFPLFPLQLSSQIGGRGAQCNLLVNPANCN